MKNRRLRSLKKRIFVSMAVIFILFTLLLLYSNVSAVDTIRRKNYEMARRMLTMYASNLRSDMGSVWSYLLGVDYNNSDYTILRQNEEGTEFYAASYRERMRIANTLPGLSGIDGIFSYYAKSNHFIYALQADVHYRPILKIREWLRSCVTAGKAVDASGWFPMEIEGNWYFIRLRRINSDYVGAYVRVDSLLEPLTDSPFENERIFFAAPDGALYGSAVENIDFNLDPAGSSDAYTLVGDRQRYLFLAEKTGLGDFYVGMLIPDQWMLDRLGEFGAVLMLETIGIVFLAAALTFLMKRHVTQPINRLTDAIRELRDGNFNIRVSENSECTEFSEVNAAFNEMVSEIHSLRIDVYEEQLDRKATECKYLKGQIAPHFLINCLNLIYHLVSSGETEKVKSMVVELGEHLRYTLSEAAFVPLRQEIDHAVNFLEISRLRYPQRIRYSVDLAKEAENAAVIPMIVLTFVENAVKHEAVAGRELSIYLRARVEGSSGRVHITVWDTGDGFSEEYLAAFQSSNQPQGEGYARIGIVNTIRRLRYAYGDDAAISLCNREGAGAQIDVTLPMRPYGGVEK